MFGKNFLIYLRRFLVHVESLRESLIIVFLVSFLFLVGSNSFSLILHPECIVERLTYKATYMVQFSPSAFLKKEKNKSLFVSMNGMNREDYPVIEFRL